MRFHLLLVGSLCRESPLSPDGTSGAGWTVTERATKLFLTITRPALALPDNIGASGLARGADAPAVCSADGDRELEQE